ncbi:MAG: AraC family ligand binding domain-containing protein [Vicinamibacterales bacterium]
MLSARVAGSRYIFPNLAPARDSTWALALAGREECAPDYLVERDSYPFHVIEYVAEGSGVAQLGRRPEQRIAAGSIFAYSPDMKCRIRTEPAFPLVKFFFALAGREVEKMLAQAALSPGTIRRFAAPAEGLTIAEDIVHEGQRHTAMAPAVCLKLLELLLLKAADAAGAMPSGDERARDNFLRCRALIEAQADRLASLEEIAAAVAMDGASVCRLFRRFQAHEPLPVFAAAQDGARRGIPDRLRRLGEGGRGPRRVRRPVSFCALLQGGARRAAERRATLSHLGRLGPLSRRTRVRRVHYTAPVPT